MVTRSFQQITNQKAFEKRKQMTIKIIVEKRGEYDNNENDDIDNDVENEYREGPETKRR